MKNKKYQIYLTDEEYSKVIKSILKNYRFIAFHLIFENKIFIH